VAERHKVKVTVKSITKGECSRGFKPGDSWIIENVNDAEKCRANILDAFESLQIVSEIKKLQETYENLKASTYKARRATEEISLLRLVPGRCRVCRRLGI